MNAYKVIKVLVLIFAVTMFFWAVKRSVLLLTNPPIVEETELKHVSKIVPPLITVCPSNQDDVKVLQENGYTTKLRLLAGSRLNDQTTLSWNGNANKTFSELISKIYDRRFVDSINMTHSKGLEASGTTVFMPRYGLCKEYLNYNTLHGLNIQVGDIVRTVHIFLTDSVARSHISPDFSSQTGQFVTGFV